MKKLDLSKTNIKELPKSITALKHLEVLYFEETQIKGFPEEVLSFQSSLKRLFVDEVEQLPEEISAFDKLIEIGGKIHSFRYLDKIPSYNFV